MVLKKIKKILKQTGQGFQVGGSAYKGVFTGKGVKPAKDLAKKFRKEDLKVQAKSGKTAKSRMEAKNRITIGDDKIDAAKAKHKKFQENRKKMKEMRKNNPEKYRKLKKKQRKEEMAKSFKSRSSTWD